MVRIGVLGDSHGDLRSINQAVSLAGAVDLWLHTGDFCRDAMVLATLTTAQVLMVAGNCDGRSEAKPDEFVELAGFHIWLTHGHRHGVKQDTHDLADWALRYEADIVVYGHTHQALVKSDAGILLFNPGSTVLPRRGKKGTFGVLELSEQPSKINPQLISLP
jgi:putative phosphoesterase